MHLFHFVTHFIFASFEFGKTIGSMVFPISSLGLKALQIEVANFLWTTEHLTKLGTYHERFSGEVDLRCPWMAHLWPLKWKESQDYVQREGRVIGFEQRLGAKNLVMVVWYSRWFLRRLCYRASPLCWYANGDSTASSRYIWTLVGRLEEGLKPFKLHVCGCKRLTGSKRLLERMAGLTYSTYGP